MEKLTTEEFIKKAREVQWEWYDYSKVDNGHGARHNVTFTISRFMVKSWITGTVL